MDPRKPQTEEKAANSRQQSFGGDGPGGSRANGHKVWMRCTATITTHLECMGSAEKMQCAQSISAECRLHASIEWLE
jgi:hypothetical protein